MYSMGVSNPARRDADVKGTTQILGKSSYPGLPFRRVKLVQGLVSRQFDNACSLRSAHSQSMGCRWRFTRNRKRLLTLIFGSGLSLSL